MTPKQARDITNREAALYNKFREADARWVDYANREQQRARDIAHTRWVEANQAWFEAVRNYPHLFAPFSASW